MSYMCLLFYPGGYLKHGKCFCVYVPCRGGCQSRAAPARNWSYIGARKRRRARCKGALKKMADPDIYLISFRGTNQPHILLLLICLKCVFRRFSVRGAQMHHKSTFPEKIDKNFVVSLFSTFFVLSRFRVFPSNGRWGFKSTTKSFFQKSRVESRRVFTKKSIRQSKADCFSVFVTFVFCVRVLALGVS
jgi:hypothetical protein